MNMDKPIIEIDIHGMNKVQAKTYIDGILKKAGKNVFRIEIIHGFHGGSSLRDMVRSTYKNNPKVKRIELGLNNGATTLILREL